VFLLLLFFVSLIFSIDFDWQESTDDRGIAFHTVSSIAGYVPQVRSNLFSFPLIVCQCENLGDHLFDWYVQSA
jgi:hypothetical protein